MAVPNVAELIAIQPREASIYEKNTGQKQSGSQPGDTQPVTHRTYPELVGYVLSVNGFQTGFRVLCRVFGMQVIIRQAMFGRGDTILVLWMNRICWKALRYTELNPVRAGMVDTAEGWE